MNALSPTLDARVRRAMPSAAGVARRMARSLGLDPDDATGTAYEVLVVSARSFDPHRGLPFERWALLRVRGAVIDLARSWGPAPKRVARALREAGADGPRYVRLHPHLAVDTSPLEDVIDARRELQRVARVIADLPEPERLVLEGTYLAADASSQKHASQLLRLSKSWTSRLHKRALERLRIRAHASGGAREPL